MAANWLGLMGQSLGADGKLGRTGVGRSGWFAVLPTTPLHFPVHAAGVAELADALDLGSSGATRAGSIPVARIHISLDGRCTPHERTCYSPHIRR